MGDLGFHLGEHGIVDFLMDESAAGRAAGLAAPGEIHAADHASCDFIGVGVRIGDQRVLAAKFEHDRF